MQGMSVKISAGLLLKIYNAGGVYNVKMADSGNGRKHGSK